MSIHEHFEELIFRHGRPETIPDLDLYRCIAGGDARQEIVSADEDSFKASMLRLEVVRRARSDLFFLAKYFLWDTNPEGQGKPIEESRMTEATHRPVCEMYVKKDCAKTIADQDKVYKNRLILYPRGGLKSTIDIADSDQWILNFPEIRILFLTAADPLASGFVDAVKSDFVKRLHEPSLMNLFFPEWCVDEKGLGAEGTFTCPLWAKRQVKRPEPTVMAAGITSTLSGFHFDVIKPDDSVSNKNSENEEQCARLDRNYRIIKKMLMTYGYNDINGTRYRDDDLYGVELEKNIGQLSVETGLKGDDPRPWELTLNQSTRTKILIGRGWKLKPEPQEKLLKGAIKESDLGESDYFILFPELLPYGELRRQQLENEEIFEGQINQNPRPPTTIVFDRPLLLKHTIPHITIPIGGPIVVTWDFGFSTKKRRDYTTAAVGRYNNSGQLYIVDLLRARFNATSLAQAIVDMAQRYRPVFIGIEDAPGSRFLEPHIIDIARGRSQEVLNLVAKIDWFVPDHQVDAKRLRMASLHPWLMNDRLFFSASLPHLETLYYEFERCLTSHHHDDIPDVISQQMRYAPRLQTMVAKNEITMLSPEEMSQNLVFGLYGYDGPIPCDLYGRPALDQPAVSLTPQVEQGIVPESQVADLPSMLGSGLCG